MSNFVVNFVPAEGPAPLDRTGGLRHKFSSWNVKYLIYPVILNIMDSMAIVMQG